MNAEAMDFMYCHRVDFIANELKAIGKSQGQLSVMDLVALDHYHYRAIEALDEAALHLGITAQEHVLDIGSGVGGPARYLAWRYGCQVTAVELQAHLHQAAVELTERTGLSAQVQLRQGDFVDLNWEPEQVDHWLSFLVFLHIPDRTQLFARAAEVLKPGGQFYIEDFFMNQPLTHTEQKLLAEVVACPYLPTQEQYLKDLQEAGFVDLIFEEVTDLWTPITQERADKFRAQQERHLNLHGAALVANRLQFYDAVAQLFAGGNIGGARITGRKQYAR